MPGVAALLVMLAVPLALLGHDLWIVPPANARAGGTVRIALAQGMEFPRDEDGHFGLDPKKLARLLAVGPDGSSCAVRPAGHDENGGYLDLEAAEPGIYVVGVETTPKALAMEAEAFNAYLVSDGLARIFLDRHAALRLGEPARERYSKSPKAIVRVERGAGEPGTGAAAALRGDPTRPLGLHTEIVPLADPFKLESGMTLRVRALHEQKPLANVWLGWDAEGDGAEVAGLARTDSQGEALIPIARSGLLCVRLTHMTRPQTADYEWESFWTTLTFRVP